MPKPTMDAADSSNIEAIGYDAEASELYVQFKGGSTYIYEGVPSEVHDEFKASPSKGAFLSSRIKPEYKFRKDI